MAPQFTSVPTKHAVRPLLSAPCPVTLPVLLTNIIPEEFPLPRMLIDIDTSRPPTPPLGPLPAPTCPAPTPPHPIPAPPRRAPTPAAPRHPTPDSRESSLTPAESDDDGSNSSFTTKKSKGADTITRPSNANIQTVKSLFKELYPTLTQQEQDKQYTEFRTTLDTLCTRYLRPSLALTRQDKAEVNKVNKKMTETFPWLAHYDNYWPMSVCLQGKLHNSAARAHVSSTKKAVSILTGTALPRSTFKRPEKKRKAKKA
ncbi:hypothetical protein DFH07DRAFT_955792 [Mycena maculata]|uniref:Uncharacterized protein n=1 Tax=Mycena maculata TaxID=230809 RepID=A0AAD7JHH6_9AGAR|nr:hypothetical protein DFH07DRAFT_955792 [Mycena maculata]